MNKIFVYIFIFVCFALFILGGTLLIKKFVFGEYPFFVQERLQVTGTGWRIGEFQPVYLYRYKRDNALFIKTIYFDDKNIIKFQDVFVGGLLDGKEIELTPYKAERDKTTVYGKKVDEFNFPLSFGKRFKIMYLVKVDELGAGTSSGLCQDAPDFCVKAEYVHNKGEIYEVFSKDHRMKSKDFLISTQISDELFSGIK